MSQEPIIVGRLTTYLPNNEGICSFAVMEENILGTKQHIRRYFLASRPLLVAVDRQIFQTIKGLISYYSDNLEPGVTMEIKLLK